MNISNFMLAKFRELKDFKMDNTFIEADGFAFNHSCFTPEDGLLEAYCFIKAKVELKHMLESPQYYIEVKTNKPQGK